MFRPLLPRPARRGNTLIVVLACLTLLAIVGIAAVYFARDQAERARIQGAASAVDTTFPDNGMGALNAYLAGWIYDTQDVGQGLINPLRGHSLTGTMYSRIAGSTVAWNGIGTFSEGMPGIGLDRKQFVNFQLFPNMPGGVIFDPEYSNPSGRAPTAGPSGTLIPKNAPYTYPDIKDFYLAVQAPSTGEILVPSYHRAAAFGVLDPSNPNWTNAQGKFLTLRPRPADHSIVNGVPQFPPIPANADNTYTGDVQNLTGAFGLNGMQRNDSIWTDIGLSPFTLPNGKRVKPLIAPLILDLNGRLNLSIHGNRLGTGGVHTSGAGFGPWEISLERAFGAANAGEARQLVLNRGAAQTVGGTQTRAFAPRYPANNQLPLYSAVPWTGNGGANGSSLILPNLGGASPFATVPTYATLGANPGYDSTNNPFTNHPALFNPTEWLSAGGGANRGYPVSDTKAILSKYAALPSYYNTSVVGSTGFAPNSLGGTLVPSPNNPPGRSDPDTYRTDQAHAMRQLFTTYGYSLDRLGLTPTSGQTTALFAALGGIDLNRALPDYRNDTTQPLSPATMTNQAAADAARQQFAMDIFTRLIVAAGPGTTLPTTAVNVNTGALTITATSGSTEYNTLQALAQLAVNIVDYIDSDDISTRFAWYPGSTQVVYGVEKPRLVINEAYAEIVNDPSDQALTNGMVTASKDAHVRFFLELQNPTSTPYNSGGVGPLGDGSVSLVNGGASAYQIKIVRNSKVAASPVSPYLRDPATSVANVTGDLPAGVAEDIKFQFTAATITTVKPSNGSAAPNAGMVLVAANVASDPQAPPTGAFDFNPTATTFPPAITITAAATPAAIGGSTTALSYPFPLTAQPDQDVPDPTKLGWHVVLLQRLANPYAAFDATANPYITVDILDNVRAADRILLANNAKKPFRTARTTAAGPGVEAGAFPPASSGKVQPYTAYSSQMSLAAPPKFPTSLVLYQNPVSPDSTGVLHTFGLVNSSKANPTLAPSYVPASGGTSAVLLNNETLMTPFDWFVHLDRPLINQLELLHVTALKPHEWTLWSEVPNGQPAASADVVKFGSTAQTLITNTNPPNTTPFGNPAVYQTTAFPQLYQALDSLRIQPYGHMTALGGRLPGLININTIQDIRVFRALLDAQQSVNGFLDSTDVTNFWNNLMVSRSPNLAGVGGNVGLVNKTDTNGNTFLTPIPGATVYDNNGPSGDRPFLPFGVSTIPAGGYSVGTASMFGGGTGVDDTLLRRNPPVTGVPYLTVPGTTHPYQQLEAARKILNNTTTVSHNFAVWVTVGYFEVVNETAVPAGWPAGITYQGQLGREYFQSVPGDTRYKFFAVVDRSNIGLDPQQFQSGASIHATVRPFFTTVATFSPTQPATQPGTTLTIYAPNGQVNSDGNPVTVGGTLVVGTGANRDFVTVTGVATTPTTSTLTLAGPGLTKTHYPGESVSNILPGNPGPQPTFDVTQAPYTYVVPQWAKIP